MGVWSKGNDDFKRHHMQVMLLSRVFPIERFHHGRGLFLLLAVATGFYMLNVPNWESLPPKY